MRRPWKLSRPKPPWKGEGKTAWIKPDEKNPKATVTYKRADVAKKYAESGASDERLDQLEEKLEKIDELLSEIRQQQGKLKDSKKEGGAGRQ